MTKLVVDISKFLGVDINQSGVSIAHRLPPKNVSDQNSTNEGKLESVPPPLIARFVNHTVCNEIYKNRKQAKTIDKAKFPGKDMINLYMNKNLTLSKKHLQWLTKEAAKAKGYKYIWTKNGKMLTRVNDSDPIIEIRMRRFYEI